MSSSGRNRVKREGILRHANRSANDGDQVRHGFDLGDLRGARQKLAERTQIAGRTAEHYMLLTLFETNVRNLLVKAINHGMDDGFHELAVQADGSRVTTKMAHQRPARGTSCKYPSSGAFGNCWSRTVCGVW